MEEKINVNDIIWIDANAVWLYPIMQDYAKVGKDLGMNYLSLGSLRYNEKYFVGYVYNKDSVNIPIELVAYIQYKMIPGKLTINYMETAERYRGNGISRITIDEFVNRVVTDRGISVCVTTLSNDGKRANIIGKFQDRLTGEVVETSKRNVL
jgi:hypothetical protein